MSRVLAALLGAALLPTSCAPPSPPADRGQPAATPGSVATFAMGCFWCGETAFEGLPGVLSVVSGYTGGTEQNPSYEQVGAGRTGHLEAVQVTFDPARISYGELVDIFWHSIDPTQEDGQFCDRGPQYRSAIFHHDDAQRDAALDAKRRIEAAGLLAKPIATRILPASTFWPAEEAHQDFWKKNPARYRSYREGCGRDRRLAEIWGEAAAKPAAH